MQLMPSKDAVSLITVLPEQLQSPLLTAEWEHRLSEIERGELSPEDFLVGSAPCSGSWWEPIRSSRGLSTCSRRPAKWWANAPAAAVMWRNCKRVLLPDRILQICHLEKQQMVATKKKQPTKALVTALLKDGRARITGCYSEKTGKTYDATVVLEDDGRYANFKLEFDRQKGGAK